MTKKIIEKQVDYLSVSYNSLTYVMSQIQEMIDKYGEDAEVRLEEDYDSYQLNVYAKVLETDEEYTARLKQEAYFKDIQEQRELREYQRLQAKFGDKE